MNELDLFTSALALLDPAERGVYLDRACADNPDLRHRLNELLSAHARSNNLLDSESAGETATGAPLPAGATATFGTDAPAPTADFPGRDQRVGEVIAGRYRLLEAIGEGGMGSVWLAQQSEPVKRKVAVKLIKAGMDSKQVLARFDAERQALALMDHPNIAKVLDGGLHNHLPYFVMELVKGVPITDYCDARRLTPRERLELFVQVCHAIQHAHQKGVIHRDIKPSNVLIALYDDKPVAKVIDFGVAKATGGALTERTLDTGFGGVVGTPQYMSPEQATFNNLDIDTRSDVYALGVLLYELLTGTTPFSQKELEKKGLLEVLRVVREEEPPRPSTKLSTAAALPTLSANRGTEPKKLTGLLRNELDWIVMKALEKDRTRRYETANGFAADVLRYLGGEAVQAHPPSTTYRLKKVARRNRVALAAATAVAAAVLAGLGGSAWQAVRATRAEGLAAERLGAEAEARAEAEANEARAVTEALRAAAVADLLRDMLESANPEAGRKAGVTVRDLLDQFGAGLDDQLRDQPEVEATVREVIGRAYWRLGVYDQAAPHLERAAALRRRTPGIDPRVLAASLALWGRALESQGKTPAARAVLEEAVALHRRSGSAPQAVIQSLISLQTVARREKRDDDGDRHVAEARAAARALPGGDDPGLACMLHHQSVKHTLTAGPAGGGRAGGPGGGGDAPSDPPGRRPGDRVGAVRAGPGATRPGTVRRGRGHAEGGVGCLPGPLSGRRVPRDEGHPRGTHGRPPGPGEGGRGRGRPGRVRRSANGAGRGPSAGPEGVAGVGRGAPGRQAVGPGREGVPGGGPARRPGGPAGPGPDRRGAPSGRGRAPRAAEAGGGGDRLPGGGRRPGAGPGRRPGRLAGPGQPGPGAVETRVGPRRSWPTLGGDRVLPQGPRPVEATPGDRPGPAVVSERALALDRAVGRDAPGGRPGGRSRGGSPGGGAAGRRAVRPGAEQLGVCGPARVGEGGLDRAAGQARGQGGGDSGGRAGPGGGAVGRRAVRRLGDRARESPQPTVPGRRPAGRSPDRPGRRPAAGRGGRPAPVEPAGRPPGPGPGVRRPRAARRGGRGLGPGRRPGRRAATGRIPIPPGSQSGPGRAGGGGDGGGGRPGPGGEALTLYNAACVHALAAGGPDPAPDHARRAIELLRQAAAKGYASPDFAVGDDDLAALHGLPEFRAVLAEMGKPAPGVYSGALAVLGMKLLGRRAFAAAEPVARESLGLREKEIPDDWRTANARVLLGGALLGQGKSAAAEPLLVSGYEGMKRREGSIPPAGKVRLADAADRLVELYIAFGKPAEAARWRAERALYPPELAPPPREMN